MKRLLSVSARRMLILLYVAFCLFPVYWMVLTSVKKPVDALSYPPRFFSFVPTLENYVLALTNPEIIGYFANSLIIGLGSTGLGLLLGVPVAYALGKHSFKGKSDYTFWVLTTRMAPPVAMLLPFFIMYRQLGLVDTHIGVIIVHISHNLAIIIWVMKSFFTDVPLSFEEAAMIDGCTHWQAFTRVILPVSLPGIAATGILSFVFSWNEFLFALVLTSQNARTVPVGLYNFIGYQQIRWGELSASAFFMIIPVLLIVVVFQKQLIRGLTFGAVEG